MEIPGIRIVRRALKKQRLDSVVPLAVLMRAMTADHADEAIKDGSM